jgi:hypothetical protein
VFIFPIVVDAAAVIPHIADSNTVAVPSAAAKPLMFMLLLRCLGTLFERMKGYGI